MREYCPKKIISIKMLSSKTLLVANQDTSGPRYLDTSGRKTLPAQEISGPKP